MSYIAEKFKELGVVPIVVLENTKDALPLAKEEKPGEYTVTVSFHLKEDKAWAEAGHEVAFGQYVYKIEEPKKTCPEGVKVIRSTHNIGVRGAHFEVLFSVLNGGLVSYKYAGKESIIQECENSLKRLKTDYIDLYQIHWADITTPISETFEAVARLIEQGKIRYAGVCNYTPEQIEEADKAVNIISDQIPFSMVNRGSEDKTIPFCIRNKKSVIAYSPMERGLLTGKMIPGQNFKKGDHRKTNPYFTDDSIIKTNAFLAKIKPIADEKGITLSQLVLRWTIDHPGITIALAGARNKEQAISNARAADVHLSNDEILFINKQLEFL